VAVRVTPLTEGKRLSISNYSSARIWLWKRATSARSQAAGVVA
jgi:hypothetical protein